MFHKMIYISTAVCCFGLCSIAFCDTYSPADAKFSVWFPNKPKIQTSTVSSGSQKMKLHYLSADRDDLVYYLVYSDFRSVESRESSEILEDELRSMARKFGSRVKSKKKISHLGHPAIDFMFEGRSLEGRGRFVLVDNRVYRMLATTRVNEFAPDSADRFFNSLKFKKNSSSGERAK